jgi:hypothetical protein
MNWLEHSRYIGVAPSRLSRSSLTILSALKIAISGQRSAVSRSTRPFSSAVVPHPAWTSALKIAVSRQPSAVSRRLPSTNGVTNTRIAGARAFVYSCWIRGWQHTAIFICRGAAPDMDICPENSGQPSAVSRQPEATIHEWGHVESHNVVPPVSRQSLIKSYR